MNDAHVHGMQVRSCKPNTKGVTREERTKVVTQKRAAIMVVSEEAACISADGR